MAASASQPTLAGSHASSLNLRRVAFVLALASTPLLARLHSSDFVYPGITHALSLVPFAVLMLLPVLELGCRRWRWRWRSLASYRAMRADERQREAPLARVGGQDAPDWTVLALLALPLALESRRRLWPVLLAGLLMAFLALRMARLRASSRRAESHAAEGAAAFARPGTSLLPRSWLTIGILVLALVHGSWALGSQVNSDVSAGSVHGALSLLHGQPVYGPEHGPLGQDPHTDTYGPLDYEAYLPLAALSSATGAAQLATLCFTLLTALLLFLLGRRTGGRDTGVLLAFCWLAFPLTLYEEAMHFNDSVVAASVVAVLLVAHRALPRGLAAALAVWTKLSPMILLPLLACHRPEVGAGEHPLRARAGAWRETARFGVGVALGSLLLFVPVLMHSSPTEFIQRTFAFQSSREPVDSLWSSLPALLGVQSGGVGAAIKVIHGLCVAAVATTALLAVWAPGRRSLRTLAAEAAFLLIATQLCLNYFSYSYILWFAPLVLVALTAGREGGKAAAQPVAAMVSGLGPSRPLSP